MLRKQRIATKDRFSTAKREDDIDYDKWQKLIDPKRTILQDNKWFKKANPNFFTEINKLRVKDHIRLVNKK